MFHGKQFENGKGRDMNPIQLMMKLAVSAQSYEVGCGGGRSGIPVASMVAASLGMGDLKKEPYLAGLYLVAQQHELRKPVTELLTAAGRRVFMKHGWKTDYCYGIAEMCLFEICWPKYTDALESARDDVRFSEVVLPRSLREQAILSGIEQSRFARTWAPRANEMRLILAGWMDDCARHIRRHYHEQEEAA